MRRDDTLCRWTTLSEQSYDKRTGATVFVCRHVPDGWMWKVNHGGEIKIGHSSSRKYARAAARKYVRTLDTKPEKQLLLFSNQ